MKKKKIFGRNDVEARASVRTPSYAPAKFQQYMKNTMHLHLYWMSHFL